MKRKDIDELLHPRSIAIVGASSTGYIGATAFLDNLIKSGYAGKLYPVNPKVESSCGIKAYPSLLDVPGHVDHVIVGIPARYTPAIVKDAIEKKVKSLHIFSSGFKEVNTQEGIALQKEIAALAQGKVRIIGPNCMGMYNPKEKIVFEIDQPTTEGDAAFLSHSGKMAITFVEIAEQEKNYCSKVISVGNAADLHILDFIEYFNEDDKTKSVSMYIEGIRNGEGQKILKLLKNTTKKKPVLLLKGGQKKVGAEAAVSHTGAMASDYRHWKALARQTGTIIVDSLYEMHDFIKLHRWMMPPKSKNTCLITLSGGNSVTYTDVCEKNGIELPSLGDDLQDELLNYIPDAGTIRRNPIDLTDQGFYPQIVESTIKTVGKDTRIDSVVFVFEVNMFSNRVLESGVDPYRLFKGWASAVSRAKEVLDIPILCVNPMNLDNPQLESYRRHLKEALDENKIPNFFTIERAAKALNRYCEYNQYLKSNL